VHAISGALPEMTNGPSLMEDFKPFEILPGNHDSGMVILGDHAMNRLPEGYGKLGLPETAFARHIAYDIGIEGLVRSLSTDDSPGFVNGILGAMMRAKDDILA
jgi:predicted N-formylglutamate amidohydrolase